jgi:TetR/AcrR family transcriptional regulator, lmrAB and yxaGH operons repressor
MTKGTRDTRDRMIRTTGRLLRKQGYHGTGLNEIVAEADAPKGSMYFHFPGGKAQLAAAAIDHYAERVTRLLHDLVVEHGSQADGMGAYLQRMADGFDQVGFEDGCTVATVAAEAAPSEPRLAEATARALRGWVDALTKGLELEGHDPVSAHRLATAAIALIEGAIVMARGTQSAEPVRQIREVVVSLLQRPTRRRSRKPAAAEA